MGGVAKMRQHVKHAAGIVLGVLVFLSALTLGVEYYGCRPYTPPTTCEPGLYEVRMYEQMTDAQAAGVAESHCVAQLPNRFYVETVRLTSYSPDGEIRHVAWFEDLELPVRNAVVCRID
jgi:hypothetical protein